MFLKLGPSKIDEHEVTFESILSNHRSCVRLSYSKSTCECTTRKGLPRKALTVCHRVHREVREEPSCFREDRRVAEEAVLRDIHSRLEDNPARPHEVLRVDDVAVDSVADKGRPPKPRPVVCWNSMVSDHRTRSCYHLSTIHSSSDPAKYFPSS